MATLIRVGRRREAADAYRAALSLATDDTDRRYLTRRLAEWRPPARDRRPGRGRARGVRGRAGRSSVR